MTITITSSTLSDYDAHLAVNTATAFLRQSDLAHYLIDQLEQQRVTLTLDVSSDPGLANKNASNKGEMVWSLHTRALPNPPLPEATQLINRAPAEQRPYITSLWVLMHLLATACEQLNSHLNFRDADATWPWLDEQTLSASDIERVVARELSEQPLPQDNNWDRLLNGA